MENGNGTTAEALVGTGVEQRWALVDKLASELPSRVSITHEPLTYRSPQEGGRHSYFHDRFVAEKDPEADARIRQHGNEMRVLSEETTTRKLPDGTEVRVNPSRTDGKGGYFSPPRWLVDQAATAPRPNRVLAALVPNFPLPPGASEISIPALTTGTKVEPDADNAPNIDQDIVDARVSSPVVSVSGQEDVAIQWLEQAPPGAHVDSFIFKDMEESFNANLEEQCIVGAGSSEGGPFEQFTGLLNLTGINTVTYTDGSPTGPKMFPELGKAFAAIGKKRYMPPEAWMMTTARWAWLCTQEDNSARPLILACNNDTSNFPVGSLLGIPVYLNDALPLTRGAAKNQDIIVCCRPKDFMLLESEPKLAIMEDVLSGTMEVRLIMNRYVAFLGGKYPSGVSVIQGSGLVVQSGY